MSPLLGNVDRSTACCPAPYFFGAMIMVIVFPSSFG